jgi:hypothetical protein
MMRPSLRSIALSSTALLLLVGGGWVWLQNSSAALSTTFPSTGTRATCNLNRYPIVIFNSSASVKTSSTGAISAVVGKVSKTSDGRDTAELDGVSTLTKGTADGFGDITISNDTSRIAESSLTSNQAGRSFPATQTMRFYPVVTLNGETFQSSESSEPATLINTSVPSFPAPAGTVYVLANPLTLKSADGNTLTVQAGKVVTITGSSSQ